MRFLKAVGMGIGARGAVSALALVAVLGSAPGCVTQGDFRNFEERILDQTQHRESRAKQVARLSAEIDGLREEQRKLAGRVAVAERKADKALAEARKARSFVAARPAEEATGGAVAGSTADESGSAGLPAADEGVTSEEVIAYQRALEAWRGSDQKLCIDRFRKFLQDYPASPHADDGAYWMADCHFKQGDYRVAVLRFNDVVRVYPAGNKAADALYRQGESLLKLGPGFHDAARTVFQQVVKDYPESARANEAKKQLSVLGSG